MEKEPDQVDGDDNGLRNYADGNDKGWGTGARRGWLYRHRLRERVGGGAGPNGDESRVRPR